MILAGYFNHPVKLLTYSTGENDHVAVKMKCLRFLPERDYVTFEYKIELIVRVNTFSTWRLQCCMDVRMASVHVSIEHKHRSSEDITHTYLLTYSPIRG